MKYWLKFLNTHIEFDNEGNIIIWCVHDKTFTYGSYYKIYKNKDLVFVIEKEQEHIEIPIINK